MDKRPGKVLAMILVPRRSSGGDLSGLGETERRGYGGAESPARRNAAERGGGDARVWWWLRCGEIRRRVERGAI